MNRRAVFHAAVAAVMAASLFASACGGNKPPVAKPLPPPPPPDSSAAARPPLPPEPVPEPVAVPPEPLRDDGIRSGNIDEINRNSPLKPVFFDYDSAELSPAAKSALDENASVLKKYGTWVLTIEGHCDERGTSEYNLALGARRARAVKDAMAGMGISPDRMSTVSYGEELPLCKETSESCWATNRRAHFIDVNR